VFTVDHEKQISEKDKLKITKSTLARVAEDRPEHRQVREKFDSTKTDWKNVSNKLMTIEDNIH
jgi:hypothetical protein